MQIIVKDTLKDLSKQLAWYEKQFLPKATTRALNKVGGTVFSRAVKEVAKNMGVKQSVIRNGKFIIVSKASYKKQVFTITFKNEHLSLYKMGAAQSGGGVTVKAWGRKQNYPGAFIATMPNGKRDVFVRTNDYRGAKREVKTGKNIGKTYRPGLKIHKLYGPRVLTAYNQQRVDEVARKVVEERLPIEFIRALNSILGRF